MDQELNPALSSPPGFVLKTPAGVSPEQLIVNMGFVLESRGEVDKHAARQTILAMLQRKDRNSLVLVEHPTRFGIEGLGACYDCEGHPTIAIVAGSDYVHFKVLTGGMAHSVYVQPFEGRAIDKITQIHSQPFDVEDRDGLYFQFSSAGVSWLCTIGICVDAETRFSVYAREPSPSGRNAPSHDV